MAELEHVVTLPQPRGRADTTRRRFWWLLGVSLLLHLVLTPAAGWLGLFSLLFEPPEADAPELEELNAIPIELFEDAEEEGGNELPERDPVALIDKLIPDAPKDPAAAPPPKPEPPPQPSAKPEASKPPPEPDPPDAGPPPSEEPDATQSADAGPDKPQARDPRKKKREIGDPVALAGKAGDLVKSNARLGLTIYNDRVRSHPIGKRIAQILPQLPQWRDFFGGTQLNPVEHFDRLFMSGPSFYYSEEVVVALQYNTPAAPIRAAIDQLVQRKGQWIEDAPVPTAIAHADRADRLFVMAAPHVVLVAPPRLRAQIMKAKLKGIPAPKGDEAVLAFMKKPAKAFARFGVNMPESVSDARLRITPLENGAVELEIRAVEANADAAERTAKEASEAINGLLGLLALRNAVDRLFGGDPVTFPKVDLEADGNKIFGRQVLQKEHVDFILDRVEKHLIRRRAAPSVKPRPKRQPEAKSPAGSKRSPAPQTSPKAKAPASKAPPPKPPPPRPSPAREAPAPNGAP